VLVFVCVLICIAVLGVLGAGVGRRRGEGDLYVWLLGWEPYI
jgi:hypothetical protein